MADQSRTEEQPVINIKLGDRQVDAEQETRTESNALLFAGSDDRQLKRGTVRFTDTFTNPPEYSLLPMDQLEERATSRSQGQTLDQDGLTAAVLKYNDYLRQGAALPGTTKPKVVAARLEEYLRMIAPVPFPPRNAAWLRQLAEASGLTNGTDEFFEESVRLDESPREMLRRLRLLG